MHGAERSTGRHARAVGRHRDAADAGGSASVTSLLAALVATVLVAGVSAASTLERDAPAAAPASAAPTAAVTPPPLVALTLPVRPAAPLPPPAPGPGEPESWSTYQLAMQLVFACVNHGDRGQVVELARQGIGGVVLMGKPSDPGALAATLQQARAEAAQGVAPLLASDEEGGRVQRLKQLLGPLPTAAEMGRWDDARIEQTAHDYGVRMRGLGYSLALSPVADLASPGSYLTRDGRAFSADPARAAAAAVAWTTGLRRAGLLTAPKHWPGHGRAGDSHVSAPAVPPLAALEGSDLLPFDAVVSAGAPLVMVGHLRSEGLTEPGLPATLSPNAYAVLRGRAGNGTVLLTDSVSMAASSSALGIPPPEAAVRALVAGADSAMSCVDPIGAVAAVHQALDAGRLPRPQAVAAARRLLQAKHALGLTPVAPTTASPAGSFSAVSTGTRLDLTGTATDPDTAEPPVVRLTVDGTQVAEVAQAPGGGFATTLEVARGATVCALALNTGPGRLTPLGCVRTP